MPSIPLRLSNVAGWLFRWPKSVSLRHPYRISRRIHPVSDFEPYRAGRQSGSRSLAIHYVELGPRHIFICSQDDIVILARDHENVARNRRILKFPSSERSNVYRLPSLARTRAYSNCASRLPVESGIEERALSPPVQTSSTALVPFRDSSHNFCAGEAFGH